MKKVVGLGMAVLLTGLTGTVNAQKFSCEQIADSSVRAACLADRSENNRPGQASSQPQQVDEKAAFIAEAKRRLLDRLNDPSSAQFTQSVYVYNKTLNTRLLCGKLNAKNRLGGYVGAKMYWAKQDLNSASGKGWDTFISGAEPAHKIYDKTDIWSECVAAGGDPVE
jgi:hypothetical protein